MHRRRMIWSVICLSLAACAAVIGVASAQPMSRAPVGAEARERVPSANEPQQVGLGEIQTIVLQPRAGYESLLDDAHIIENEPNTREGMVGALTLRPSPSFQRHSLLKWYLDGIIPQGVTLLSARLELSSYARWHEWDLAVSAYPLLVAWDEATVTWNSASEGTPWNTPGCGAGVDRNSVPGATTTILGSDAVPGWHSWEITAMVQDWVDHPESNHGLILVSSGGSIRYEFNSGEGAQDLRPKLIIEYSDVPVSPSPTLEPSRTPTPTGTLVPAVTNTPTDTPDSWIDVRSAVPAYCLADFYGDTTGKPNNASYYGDVAWPETGPEDVYILHKTITSDLTVTIEVWDPGVDLDIFLLSSPDPDSLMGGERVGWGDQWFTYPNLGAGTYYVVVDGVSGSQGAYRLVIDCLGEPTPTPTTTNTPVFSFYPLLMRMPTPTPAATATFTPTPTFTPGPTALPYAVGINCGSNQSFTFEDGYYYSPDQPYTFGHPQAWGYVDANNDTGTYKDEREIYDTQDDAAYQTHRYAMDAYRFNVPSGRYELRLHFAEIFRFTPVGGRVFAVEVEGQRVLDQFDMVARGLKYTAYTETVYVDVTDGMLDIIFVPQSQEYGAAINGIRVTRIGSPTGP